MCLYPRFIKNKRYLGYNTKRPSRNASTAIPCDDYRKLYVPIGCGMCYECRRQKAQQWRVRLAEELKVQKHAYFVTLTFSNESLTELMKDAETDNDNKIAAFAVRRFLERYRKKYKKSLRHWFITELGHENTERLHLHGIIFAEQEMTNEELAKFWKYGLTDIGEYCNLQTINYIIKYVTKVDTDHKGYMPLIMCSAGLGANYVETYAAKQTYKYRPKNTKEYYELTNGQRVALPIYYRNKLFTQRERDMMWTDRLDKGDIYVNGVRVRNVHTKQGQDAYYALLKEQQRWNEKVGYAKPSDRNDQIYKVTFEMLQKARKH